VQADMSPRVPDAVQRETNWSGAPLIRDRHGLERSRVCSAPFRFAHAALRPRHTLLKKCVAWMENRTTHRRDTYSSIPDFATLNPGYLLSA
jgi:hypothetical protein